MRVRIGNLEIPSDCLGDVLNPGAGPVSFIIKTEGEVCRFLENRLKTREQKQVVEDCEAEDRRGASWKGPARVVEAGRREDLHEITYELAEIPQSQQAAPSWRTRNVHL